MSSSPSSTRLDASEGAARPDPACARCDGTGQIDGSEWLGGGYEKLRCPVCMTTEAILRREVAQLRAQLASRSAPALEGARDATGVLRTEEAPSVGRIMLGEHERACPRCGGEVFVPGEGDVRIPLPEGGMALGCRLCGNQWLRELPPALSRSREASPRDWPEDFAHENGQYECRCVECGNTFIGHKRRVICKTCASASGEIPDALETILGDREAFIAACRVGNAALVAGHGTMHDKFRAGGAAKLSALAILLKQLPPAGNEGERP